MLGRDLFLLFDAEFEQNPQLFTTHQAAAA